MKKKIAILMMMIATMVTSAQAKTSILVYSAIEKEATADEAADSQRFLILKADARAKFGFLVYVRDYSFYEDSLAFGKESLAVTKVQYEKKYNDNDPLDGIKMISLQTPYLIMGEKFGDYGYTVHFNSWNEGPSLYYSSTNGTEGFDLKLVDTEWFLKNHGL